MYFNKKFLIVIILGFGIILASIPIMYIIISFNQEQAIINVEFIPSQMKSYPNHTG
ncbi:MAG: hypothetical protein ACFE88_04155 [Candidatus Hermodarchaeota archaeon]